MNQSFSPEIINSLKKVFSGDIENTAETLEKYSRDASMFVVQPELVVFPKNSKDIQSLVKWANEQTFPISLTVRSATTACFRLNSDILS
jgi:FAD/FMN-containing dehydrogenase